LERIGMKQPDVEENYICKSIETPFPSVFPLATVRGVTYSSVASLFTVL
jgi:hypothetical protein